MGCTIELSDVHHVAFVFEHGCFVVIHVQIIRCRKDGHDRGETSRFGLAIHAIAADDESDMEFDLCRITNPAS